MLVAIAGGIGCGKSVVSRIVETLGHEVYDCDRRAAAIMDEDAGLRRMIAEKVHPGSLAADGSIDRKRLSEIVFGDYEALQRLNAIVHAAVRDDLALWASRRSGKLLFVETAILYQSGIDRMVDAVWQVDAPVDLRIERVMARNGVSREEVMARMASQDRYVADRIHPSTFLIVNDGVEALLPQIEALLK